jgi:23S rRNA (cytosine1962-C5)-methyltransferase
MYSSIVLKPGKEASILRFHPWVFSGAIAKIEGSVSDGERVWVLDAKGKTLGLGHYHEGNISVRIFAFGTAAHSWERTIGAAYALRQRLGLSNSKETNCYRLIHGEADQCSGLIVDVYDGVAVLQAHSIGMHREREALVAALQAVLGKALKAVYDKSQATLPPHYGAKIQNGYLWQAEPKLDHPVVVRENGCLFEVDWVEGQKTGFFLDQRNNRQLLGQYVQGKRVLNAFCYSGGFSIYALKGGATQVDSIDASKSAIALVERNVALNGLDANRHRAIVGDVQQFLRTVEQPYEVMVLDPPAYAKSLHKRHQAVQGYRRLNQEGLKRLAPGGILFTFSCSQVVDMELFQGAVLAAAIDVGRSVRLLARLQQPADHPISLFHPEGNYLKGLMLYVE